MHEYCIKYFKDTNVLAIFRIASGGDSNKYPKHIFCEEIIIKEGLSYISSCFLRIFYNSKFILMSLGTNAVVVTRVYYSSF